MPFTPGQRGSYYPKQRTSNLVRRYDEGGYEIYPVAAALESGNQPTLAWIAGRSQDFTEKSHHFPGGGTLHKSLALINDTRRNQAFTASWKRSRGESVLTTDSANGRLTIGEIRLHPISLALPVTATKTELTLSMEATIGDVTHRDTFTLRVWPAAPAAPAPNIRLMDPAGKTGQLPGLSGIPDGRDPEKPARLIVIGREAFSGGQQLPLQHLTGLQAAIASGGTLLIMAQQPEWMQRWWGFRISRHTLRQAWPVNPGDTL